MTKDKNKFTGQERESHKPLVCAKCGFLGGVKGTPPLRKVTKGGRTFYVHQGSCPRPMRPPEEIMA